jgi:cytochrome c oxidase assembly protein subunit 15
MSQGSHEACRNQWVSRLCNIYEWIYPTLKAIINLGFRRIRIGSNIEVGACMQNITKKLAFSVAIGMFLIIVMGALVTKTESGLGCGYEWPLCNGKFVPAYTISSFIEYSHRAVVGIVSLILAAVTFCVFRYSQRKDAKWFVTGAVFFTLVQAAMGAFAVIWPQSSPVLALHFGLSLLAFAFTLLLALVFTKWGDYAGAAAQNQSSAVGTSSDRRNFKRLVWITTVYTYIVVYLGAFVRHTESSGGCSGWPLCNGELIPEISGATGIVFVHRLGALVLGFLILALFLQARKLYGQGSMMVVGSKWVLITLVLQVLSGAVVTWAISNELFYLFAGMVHAVIVTCLFGFLCYLCILTLYDTNERTSSASAQRK